MVSAYVKSLQSRRRLLVLGFHNIESTWCWPAPAGKGQAAFAAHLRILNRLTNVVPLKESLDILAAGGELPPRAVALTFDDGYRDNLTLAAPLLRRFGMPATIYLVPGLLSRDVHPWWELVGWAIGAAETTTISHRGVAYSLGTADERARAQRVIENDVKSLTHTNRAALIEELVKQAQPRGAFDVEKLFLDWDGARELPAAGFTIGSHTMEHPILARETPANQRHNLIESKRQIEAELDVCADTLAYPNGTRIDYDASTLAATEEAGYSYAVTTWGGAVTAQAPRFEISRALVGPTTHPARFAAFVGKRLAAAVDS